jgi:maltose O-acetyltransferase
MNVTSRAWAWYVNELAASPLLTRHQRARIYRRAGMNVQTEMISPACYFHSSDISIGSNVVINHGCHFENVGRVTIGARTGISIQVTVITSTHALGGHDCRYGEYRYEPVTIGEGCWIGVRATILAGVTIGDGCLIASNALVLNDCEPDGLYAGVPARRVRDLPPLGEP